MELSGHVFHNPATKQQEKPQKSQCLGHAHLLTLSKHDCFMLRIHIEAPHVATF